jgi:hypothetical protein
VQRHYREQVSGHARDLALVPKHDHGRQLASTIRRWRAPRKRARAARRTIRAIAKIPNRYERREPGPTEGTRDPWRHSRRNGSHGRDRDQRGTEVAEQQALLHREVLMAGFTDLRRRTGSRPAAELEQAMLSGRAARELAAEIHLDQRELLEIAPHTRATGRS